MILHMPPPPPRPQAERESVRSNLDDDFEEGVADSTTVFLIAAAVCVLAVAVLVAGAVWIAWKVLTP